MRNVHLLTGNLTQTACGWEVWSIYPRKQEARGRNPHTRLESTVFYAMRPGAVTCALCAQAMNRKADIRITSDVSH
jgi:hypothetical protein